jgi:hypothetical protein
MTTQSSESWEEIGTRVAIKMKITPQKIEYIEARGFLCHELLYLLGGRIEFVETPWKNFILKILELILPIAPICRWYPPENSELEWVGYNPQSETKVYRFTPEGNPIVIFFIEYKPGPPIAGGYAHHLFKVPQLKVSRFLRPPFEKDNDIFKIEKILRTGMVEKFTPIPMTDEARNGVKEVHLETCRGLWQVFSQK